jgi:hypothetical protein
VSENAGTSIRPERFRISAEHQVRPMAVASSLAFFGTIVLLVWGVRQAGTLVLVVGVASMVAGVALAVGLFVRTAQLRKIILIDPHGMTIITGRRKRSLPWTVVDSASVQGSRLVLTTRDGSRSAAIVNPHGPNDHLFGSLVAAAQRQLAASRAPDVPT